MKIELPCRGEVRLGVMMFARDLPKETERMKRVSGILQRKGYRLSQTWVNPMQHHVTWLQFTRW
jgi:hypothetical protein